MSTRARSSVCLAALLASLAVLFVRPAPALACSCPEQPPPAGARDEADAVFSGRVVDMRLNGGEIPEVYTVRLGVLSAWKGVETSEIIVTTYEMTSICGFPFEEGREYLVYARGEEALGVSLCSRTVLLEHAQEDLAVLGEGRAGADLPPLPPEERTLAERLRDPLWLLPAISLLAALVLAAVLLARGRSRGAP